MRVKQILDVIGLRPKRIRNIYNGYKLFNSDKDKFLRQRPEKDHFELLFNRPCLLDRFESSGYIDNHYFNMDLHVAKRIFSKNPPNHADVGSRIDGFVSHLAVFRSLTVIDIRPLQTNWDNIQFVQADMMGEVPTFLVNKFESVSSLHAIEHFGLGRYGDPIDYRGDLIGLENIGKLLKSSGTFYFAVPIGQNKIEFNAHRIYNTKYLYDLLTKDYILDRFSFINDKGEFFENVNFTESQIKSSFGCSYGCGIFELTKI